MFAALVAPVAPASATGPARVVHDVIDGSDPRASSSPSGYAELGGMVLFAATGEQGGRELWRTDGTAGGTALVADLAPGPADGIANFPHAVAGGVLYFGGAGGLWRSDGSAAGTRLLAAVEPTRVAVAGGRVLPLAQSFDELTLWSVDPDSGATRQLASFPIGRIDASPTAIGERLFFAAGRPQALWLSAPGSGEPSALATVQLRELDAGSDDTHLIAVGEQLFFIAQDPPTGAELWRSDGTPGGTRLVRDIRPGPARGVHQNDYSEAFEPFFFALGDVLLFMANDGEHGLELWRSDGTEAGTFRLTDLGEGTRGIDGTTGDDDHSDVAGGTIRWAALGGRAYFTARSGGQGLELWSTDGTADGTALVTTLSTEWASVRALTSDGSRLMVSLAPAELWISDGTADGTARLAAIDARELTPALGGVFFTGRDGAGAEPWFSDGTPAGTRRMADLRRGAPGLAPQQLTAAAGGVLFSADDGVHGRELWRSDGTDAGTRLVADVAPGAPGADPQDLTVSGPRVFFTADDGVHGRELWRSGASTELMADVYGGPVHSLTSHLVADGRGGVFFRARSEAAGNELWHSDGSPDGTQMLADLWPGEPGSFPSAIAPSAAGGARLSELFLFAADDGTHGTELWRSDGTPSGTRMVADLVAGAEPSYASGFATLGEAVVFFTARNWQDSVELWRSDGTGPGTGRIAALPGTPVWGGPIVDGERLLFGLESIAGFQIWQSDGSGSGTQALTRWARLPGQLASAGGAGFQLLDEGLTRLGCGVIYRPAASVFSLTGAGDRLLFGEFLDDGWRFVASDGTASSVEEVHAFRPGVPEALADGEVPEVVRAGNRLFFAGEDGASGRELWTMPVTSVARVQRQPCAAPTPTLPPMQVTPTPFACSDGADPCTQLEIDPAAGASGELLHVGVRLRALDVPIAGVQVDLTFPPGIDVLDDLGEPDCRVEPAIDKPGTAFAFLPTGCTAGDTCTGVRAVVLALDNVDTIADGALLFRCTVALASDLAPADYPIVLSGTGGADPDGNAVAVYGRDGTIAVGPGVGTNPSLPASAGTGGCQLAPSVGGRWALVALLAALLVARVSKPASCAAQRSRRAQRAGVSDSSA